MTGQKIKGWVEVVKIPVMFLQVTRWLATWVLFWD